MESKKLLLVEDDTGFANMLKRRMEKHGCICWQADNCNDALLACHRHMPDFILLDMKLDNESGLSLVTPMRKYVQKRELLY